MKVRVLNGGIIKHNGRTFGPFEVGEIIILNDVVANSLIQDGVVDLPGILNQVSISFNLLSFPKVKSLS